MSSEIVAEIWLQIWVTQGDIQRVGIVWNRHQLACGRLGGTSPIEEPNFGIVIELIAEHCLRSPVQHSICRIHKGGSFGTVVGYRRLNGCSDLGAEFSLLILEIDSGNMVLADIQDIAPLQ